MGVQFDLLIILFISVFGVQDAKLLTNHTEIKSLEIFKIAHTTPVSSKQNESINKNTIIITVKQNQLNKKTEHKETLQGIEKKSKYVNKRKNVEKRYGYRKKKSEINDESEHVYNDEKNIKSMPIDGAIDRSLPVFGSVKGNEFPMTHSRRKWDGKLNVEIDLYEGIDDEQIESPTRSSDIAEDSKSKNLLNENFDNKPTTASATLEIQQNKQRKINEVTGEDISPDNLDDALSDMMNTAKIELKSMKAKYNEGEKNSASGTIPQIVPSRYPKINYDILPINKEDIKKSLWDSDRTDSNTETTIVNSTVKQTSPLSDIKTFTFDRSTRELFTENIPHKPEDEEKNEDETTLIFNVEMTQKYFANDNNEDSETEQNEDTTSERRTTSKKTVNLRNKAKSFKPKQSPEAPKLNILDRNNYDDSDDNEDYDITLNDVTTSSTTEKTYYSDHFDGYKITPITTTEYMKKRKAKQKKTEYRKQPFNFHTFSKKANTLLTDKEIPRLTFSEEFKYQFDENPSSNLQKKGEKKVKMSTIFTATTPLIHTSHTNKKDVILKKAHMGHKAKIPSVRKDTIKTNKNYLYYSSTKGTTATASKVNLTLNTLETANETTALSSDIRKNKGNERYNTPIMPDKNHVTLHNVQSTTDKLRVNKLNTTLVNLQATMNKLLSWELPKHSITVNTLFINELAADNQTALLGKSTTSLNAAGRTTTLPWYILKQNNKSLPYNVLPLHEHTKIETSSEPNKQQKILTSGTRLSPTSIYTTTKTNNIIITKATSVMSLNKYSQYLLKNDIYTTSTTYDPNTPKIISSADLFRHNQSVKQVKTKYITDKVLNALLKVNPILESREPSSIQDRETHVKKTSSLYRTLIQITLKELLDKSLIDSNNTRYNENADDEFSKEADKEFKDDKYENITDLIFSKTFLKGVFAQSNLYNTEDNVTLPPKDSYLNSNLGESVDIQIRSDTDSATIFDNEPVYSDPEMHEFNLKAKSLVETILNIILNNSLSNAPDKVHVIKEEQLRNISTYKHVVNRVINILNNKTMNRVLSIKESQSKENALTNNIPNNVPKYTETATTKRSVTLLDGISFEEILPLAIDFTHTYTNYAVPTRSMTPAKEFKLNTEANLFDRHTLTSSIVEGRLLEITDKERNDYNVSTNTTDITIKTAPHLEIIQSQINFLKTDNYITTTKTNDITITEINLNAFNTLNDFSKEISTTTNTVISTKDLETPIVTESSVLYTTTVYKTDTWKPEVNNNTVKPNRNNKIWFMQYEDENIKHSDSFPDYTTQFSPPTSLFAEHLKVKPMNYDNLEKIKPRIAKVDDEMHDYEDSSSTKSTLSLITITPKIETNEKTDKITYLVNIDDIAKKKHDHKTGEFSDTDLNLFSAGYKLVSKSNVEPQTDSLSRPVTDGQHQRYISKNQYVFPPTILKEKTVTLSSNVMSSIEGSIGETVTFTDPTNLPLIETTTITSHLHTSRYFYPELESSQQQELKEAYATPINDNKGNAINKSRNLSSSNRMLPTKKSIKLVMDETYTEVSNKITLDVNDSKKYSEQKKDEDKDLDKLADALEAYKKDQASTIGLPNRVTLHKQEKTMVDVSPEEISEMLYYDMSANQESKAVPSTTKLLSNKTSLLTEEILNTLLKELLLMNDVAEIKLSDENGNFPIKIDPFDPNLENIIRNLLLPQNIPDIKPKHPDKVAVFEVTGADKDEVENELYPKKVSVYDPNVDKILQKIMYYTLPPHKITEPTKATTQTPIKIQWHEVKNTDDTRKINSQNCPKIHCFLINENNDKSKSNTAIIDKLQEIYPIISYSNKSVENLSLDVDSRKSLISDKFAFKKPVTIKRPEYYKNNSKIIENKTIIPTFIPGKSFFYKKPVAVETFSNNLYENSSKIKMNSVNVPSINICGLENAPLRRIQEGPSYVEKYPWLGVLVYPKGKKRLVTTVVLVTAKLVITSAWEISKLPKNDFRRCTKVILGHNCSGPRIGVLNYNYHPDFRSGFISALAVVQIDSDSYVHILRPICPPPRQFSSPQFYSLVMPEDCTSSKIKIYKMDHVPIDSCRRYYRRHKLVTSRFWPRHSACGKARWGGACLWRSGTVLVTKQDQQWHLLGFGVPGPGCEAPSRFIDYSMHALWVELTMLRIGQSAVTRMAPNRLIFRRCLNQIQRFGPCDAEEVRHSLFQESSELFEPARFNRRGRHISRVQYNLTIWDNIDYHCVVFQAYNVKDLNDDSQPKLEIKRNAPTSHRGNYSANIDFNITIEFFDGIRYKVLAYGERSKQNDLKEDANHIEDNMIKTLAEHAEDYMTRTTQNHEKRKFEKQPAWDANNRRYIRRKSLEKFKNRFTLFHNKMAARSRRKTMEQPSRRKAKSRINRRNKAVRENKSSERQKRKMASSKKKRTQ